ncbi:MAG: YgiT-type zinc finger protein [Balneolaceae bacterium]
MNCKKYRFTRHSTFKMFERRISIDQLKKTVENGEVVQNYSKVLNMKCTTCKNGTMVDGEVTVTLQRGQSVIVIKSVPAHVCENCGDYTLDEAVTSRIMDIAELAVVNNPEIEVLQYAA